MNAVSLAKVGGGERILPHEKPEKITEGEESEHEDSENQD